MPWVIEQKAQMCSSGDSIYLSPARSEETVRPPAPPTVFHFLCSEEEKLGPIESGAPRPPCSAVALKGAAEICICSVMKVCLIKTSVLVNSIHLTPEEQQQRAKKSSQVYEQVYELQAGRVSAGRWVHSTTERIPCAAPSFAPRYGQRLYLEEEIEPQEDKLLRKGKAQPSARAFGGNLVLVVLAVKMKKNDGCWCVFSATELGGLRSLLKSERLMSGSSGFVCCRLKKTQEEDGQGSSTRGSRAGIDGHRQVPY
ncbi:uncharacterized protein EMH_0024460 [Eimeria mitis]|uniref:Uncharacterized protein n=1 Tax=Eimeria mitis TaxID=44415 RepID=U6KG01_9EIME|nr:uncharacterized protein EMH_0024460 [Eimeria mitis]CDJ35192.1 hypothetical protein EMH_0024460 [Eimeria mitis]